MRGTCEDDRGVIHVVDVTDTVTALDLEGEFDLVEAPIVSEHAQRLFDDGRHVIINLSDATFIDSTIIRALFQANAAAKAANRVFVLQVATHPGVERALAITRADRQLPTAKTRDEANELVQQLAA